MRVQEFSYREPAEIAAAWQGARHLAWLDSAGPLHPRSRYSFLCRDPFRVIATQDGQVRVDGAPVAGDPFGVLQRELAALRRPLEAGPPEVGPVPFTGGAVAVLGYELGGVLEKLPCRHPNDLNIPDMTVLFFDVVLAFDRAERRAWAIAAELPAPHARGAERALEQALALAWLPSAPVPPPPKVIWRPELDRNTYTDAVGRVLEYIRAGDIFQANFTMRHLAARPAGAEALAIYLALRANNPAPFAAFVDCGPRLAVASLSPERFLRLDPAGGIETRPIKGTRPRGADPQEDARLAESLRASEKDRAENLMIVDLLRNDIGRVADIGSIAVPSLFAVESFASVHHLVSTVVGQLAPGRDAVDLLRATFPGGSVTGAPKIRAMQIIEALEPVRRGPYCGAIGYLAADGSMQFNVAIRTMIAKDGRVHIPVGGGIVADSDPVAEYEETLIKAAAMFKALGISL